MALERDKKIFAGARVRRLRRELDLTQAHMAQQLGISASYLNLLERNQRPLSAQLLLRLVEVFGIEVVEFRGDEDSRSAASLKEVFADSLFEGLAVSNAELQDLVHASPTAAQAMLALYRAYRDNTTRLATMAEQLERRDIAVPAEALRFPIDEARDFFDNADNYFPELENAAETLWQEGSFSVEELHGQLVQHLRKSHDIAVRIAPYDQFPDLIWHLDRHRRRLFLSEMLLPSGRTFQVAVQIGLLNHKELIDGLIQRSGVSSAEAKSLCRIGLANYFAAALMMPYEQFLALAERQRYDVDILSQRYGASYEQVCHRLTTLQRPGAHGVAFFFLRLDHAGNISKRFSANGFRFARFGGACPRWNIHEAFQAPRKTVVQIVEAEDGAGYLTFSRTVSGLGRGFLSPAQNLAIGMGCRLEDARKLVYADGLDLAAARATPIGIHCRICERVDCNQRAYPPLNRSAAISEHRRGLSPFTFETW